MAAIANRVGSKFMLGPKIGSGSFGEVFVVTLIGTSEVYALKRVFSKLFRKMKKLNILKSLLNTKY